MPEHIEKAWISPAEARSGMLEGTGLGVRIALIDSGVEVGHPGLNGLELADDIAVNAVGLGLEVDSGGGHDVFGHGTAVAGILHEVAPEAEIGSFRALDAQNHSRSFVIAECARLAMERGYHIINCSFGCKGHPKFIMEFKKWVDQAHLDGVHVVAACSNRDFSIPEWPAYFTSVIGVNMAATDDDFFFYRPGAMVEFAARGERLRVPWRGGSWKVETGSSFAAPRVAAHLARMLSTNPGIPPLLVKPLLHAIAKPWTGKIAAHNEREF